MIRINNIKMNIEHTEEDLKQKCLNILKRETAESFQIVKRSVDARDKRDVFYVYSVELKVADEERIRETKEVVKVEAERFVFPRSQKSFEKKPIVVGAGPAGLFSALTLVRSGVPCTLIEQGKPVEERVKDVASFFESGKLNPLSNIQFGEGGAGTFSDGKLTTGIKDERVRAVFETFVEFGAPREILYSGKPHIGTDRLRSMIKRMRAYLIQNGCEVRFDSKLTDLLIEESWLKGIVVNHTETIETDHLILAMGHSARDTYNMLYQKGIALEQKNFSIGVRIEHEQSMIQHNQYGSFAELLEPTDYKLVSHLENGRSVYTFCVCPGGYVVGASSEEEMVCTNGMSEYKRDGKNINGAILVGINREDFHSDHPLAGIYLQQKLERDAFIVGGGNYYAPCQRVADFIQNQKTTEFGSITPSYKPGVTPANFHEILPPFITESLKEAILEFDRKIKGFAAEDAILTGVESRSSSPVRIVRGEDMRGSIEGFYPIGEGAGYAGGIVSSAVDGMKCALALIH